MTKPSVVIGSVSGVSFLPGTLSGSLGEGSNDTCQLMIKKSNCTSAAVGQTIGIYDGFGMRVFGGTIDEIKVSRLSPKSTDELLNILAVGYFQRLEKRVINGAAYKDKKAKDIVEDLLDTYAPGEVVVGSIEDGASAADLGLVNFNGVTVADALRELADRSKFVVYVDQERNIYFTGRNSRDSGLNLTGTSYRNPLISNTRKDYYNRVSVKVSWDAFSGTEEVFHGDSVTREFNVSKKIDSLRVILLNGVESSWGIMGIDTDKQFYYTPGTTTINQDVAEPILTATDELTVVYNALGENVIEESDDEDISARNSIEDGTGIYHAFVDDSSNKDALGAQQKAFKFLDRHCPRRGGAAAGTIPREITFEVRSNITDSSKLRPGYTLQFTCSTPSSGGSVTLLIQRASFRDEAGQHIWYSVEATDYVDPIDTLEFWRSLTPKVGSDATDHVTVIPGGGSGGDANGVIQYE